MHPEHQPYRSKEITYGIQTQLTDPIDSTAQLKPDGVLRLQRITGTFLYYARAIDPTMLVTLSALASYQSKAMEQTARQIQISKLLRHPSRCRATLLKVRHDTNGSFRRVLPVGIQDQKSRQRLFLHGI
jgi:hypothetical protein